MSTGGDGGMNGAGIRVSVAATVFCALLAMLGGCHAVRPGVGGAFGGERATPGSAEIAGPAATRVATVQTAITPAPDASSAALATPQLLPLQRVRPRELDAAVAFVGALPASPVFEAAWSPDGTLLAYTYRSGDQIYTDIYRPADGAILSRWPTAGNGTNTPSLSWAPDGKRVAFIAQDAPKAGETSLVRIGVGEVGNANWRALLERPDMRARLGPWLDGKILAWQRCGVPCWGTFLVDAASGEVTPVVNEWEDLPGGSLHASQFLFSEDQEWFAAVEDDIGVWAAVGRWGSDGAMLPLAAGLATPYTEPQFWSGHALAFLCYPPGEWAEWQPPYAGGLRLLNPETGERRELARGVLVGFTTASAWLDPTGSRMAVLMVGAPQMGADGVLSAEGSVPQLALLSWPEWQLLATFPVAASGDEPWAMGSFVPAAWSRDGSRLAYQPAEGRLAWVDRAGHTGGILAGAEVQWAGWGADGMVALVVGEKVSDQRVWLVRLP